MSTTHEISAWKVSTSEKESTNFEIFKKTSTYSNIDLMHAFFKRRYLFAFNVILFKYFFKHLSQHLRFDHSYFSVVSGVWKIPEHRYLHIICKKHSFFLSHAEEKGLDTLHNIVRDILYRCER